MKLCNRCNSVKSFLEFDKDKSRKDGLYPVCKICSGEAKRKSNLKLKNENPELYKRKRLQYVLNYKSNHPDRIKLSRLKQDLKKKYGITLNQYEKMLKLHNHKCAICGNIETSLTSNRLSIDHDHKTGKVRGLLCRNCNVALGLFKESIKNLENAILYLNNHIN